MTSDGRTDGGAGDDDAGRRQTSSVSLPMPISAQEAEIHQLELELERERVAATAKATEATRELQRERTKLAGRLVYATIGIVASAFLFLFLMLAFAPDGDWLARTLVLVAATIFFAGGCTAAVELTTTMDEKLRLKQEKREPLMLPEKLVSQVLEIVKSGADAVVKSVVQVAKKKD